jgi:hypothetical protein
LRTRLILALLSVAALPLIATAGGGILLARNSLVTQGQRSLISRANATANKIEGYIAQSANGLLATRQVIAVLQPGLADPDPTVVQNTVKAMEQVLASERAGQNLIKGGQVTGFVDGSGKVIAADPSGDEGLDQRKNPMIATAMGGDITIAPVSFDPGQSSDLRETFTITAPVFAAGSAPQAHPIGALYERFSMQEIAGWIQQDSDGAGGGGLLVEPDTGLILAESLPPTQYTFATLAPLPTTRLKALLDGQRYFPLKAGQAPPVATIPGLGLTQLAASAPTFSAGTFGGSDPTALTYARITLSQSPHGTPWVYLLGIPQSSLTAPADNLAVLAGIILLIAAVVSVIASLLTARWTSRWLTTGMRQLGSVATAFLKHSDEQRQTAEEQRRRLTGARAALHDLHRLASEITDAVEQGVVSLEDGTRRSPAAGGGTEGGGPAQSMQSWWTQWAQTLQERLSRQRGICERLGSDAHQSANAANHLRERGIAVYAQAEAIDAALRSGDVQRMTVARGVATGRAPREDNGARVSGGFGTGRLRLVLLGLLVICGLLPSIAFAVTTARSLRRNLTSQSTQALILQGQSDVSAVDALLAQQTQEVAGLANFYVTPSGTSSSNPTVPGSGITGDVANQALASLVLGESQTTGTSLLELASAPDGTIVAASSRGQVGRSLATSPVFKSATTQGIAMTSAVYYDQVVKQGYYYIAVPIRNTQIVGPGKQNVIAVAIGKFSLTNITAIVSGTAAQGAAQGATQTRGFVSLIERGDGLVIADSRHPEGIYAAAVPLTSSALAALWNATRYPAGQQVPVEAMPELAAEAHALTGGSNPQAFTGGGANSGSSQFGLVPIVTAPWAIAVARPVSDATAIADQLTQLDIILFIVVAAATAALALLLGQSIIVPVRRLRARFRQVARQLVVVTRRQDEAAQRQEAALPPIETTAELLALETDEVAATVFPARAPRAAVREVPTAQAPRMAGPNSMPPGYGGNRPAPMGVVDASGFQRQLVPLDSRGMPARADERAIEALRQARNIANDWSLRQQRIMADLAAAHNATDELSRACLEGQREAVELGNLVAELLASAR